MSKSLGFMYIAKRPCGRVSAACWDDSGSRASTAKCVSGYLARGDQVERIERFAGDEQPKWICRGNEPCACRDTESTPEAPQ